MRFSPPRPFSRRRFLTTAAAATPALALASRELQAQQPSAARPAAPESEAKASDALPKPILELTDRRKDIKPIPTSEREARLDLARELMKQYSIDAICITTGSSLQYYTAARWGQSERLFAYIIPANAAAMVICPYFERDRLAELLLQFPERETTLSYLWQENDDPYDITRRALADTGMATGTLGIEEHTQFAFSNGITRACPALKIVSATSVTAGCRSRKSAAELALMRLANQITLDVYKAVYLSCGPGDTNHKFSELVSLAYTRCGVHGDASCNVGVNSSIPHGSPKPQPIKEREVILIDDGCTVEGYQSDISRSFVYGTPTDFQREIFQHVHNAQSAALAAAHPGVEMQAVDAAARAVIVAAGYGPGFQYFTHRLGHGIGLDGHEWPYLVPGNAQKLEPGMTFSNEPGIYLPNRFGIRLEDDMFITEAGAELFTPQSPSLTDPFGIAASLVPAKPDTATPDTPPDATKPAPAKAPDEPQTPPKS